MIENKEKEYAAEGVVHRIAVCHIPFTLIKHDFADNYYNEWTKKLNEIGIDVMLTGHCHRIQYLERGHFADESKTVPSFPVVIGAKMSDYPPNPAVDPENEFTASAFEFYPCGKIRLDTTNSKKEIISTIEIK